MIPAASTAAWALHDLGLAASLGGTLYGRMALHPSVGVLRDPQERGEVVQAAWSRFNRLNLASHVVFASTWLIGRQLLSGRSIDRRTRVLVGIKDALVAASVLTGVTSIVFGERGIRKQNNEPAPLDARGSVIYDSSHKAKVAERVTATAGFINVLTVAGIVGITAVLAMKSGTSTRWSAISRILP